jgi:glycine oxidase
VGGGVIGLSIAFALARRGAEVTILERARSGSGASSAAAGMLAPLSESPQPGPLARIGLEALAGFEAWLGQVEEMSGVRADLVRSGTLLLARVGSEDTLRQRLEWQRELDSSVAFLRPDQVAGMAPALVPGYAAAHYPGEMQVDGPRYSQALRRAAQAAGARLLEGTPARRFDLTGSGVELMTAGGGRIGSEVVIIATGADGSLLADSGFSLPLRPVKGEMVRLRPPRPILRQILFAPGGYLTPKPDGTVLVGATQLADRYDLDVQADSVSGLLKFGLSMVPQLGEAGFIEAWAGLRPSLPDRLPAIGAVDERNRLWVAAGHFRNGVLLSGWTAGTIASALCDNTTTPAELAPNRFGNA